MHNFSLEVQAQSTNDRPGAIGCEMDGPKESPNEIALRYRRRAKQAKFAASRIKDRELSLTFLHIADDYDFLASLRERSQDSN